MFLRVSGRSQMEEFDPAVLPSVSPNLCFSVLINNPTVVK